MVYDSIEGYRIEIKKNGGKSPTTMVLKKKSEADIQLEQAEKKKKEEELLALQELEADDPDAMFETMMMLKNMHMDRDEVLKEETVTRPESTPQQETKPVQQEAKPTIQQEITPIIKTEPTTKKLTSKKTVTETIVKEKTDETENKVIQVKTKPKKTAVKKKKTTVPELSLFGTIWTILDHMTTKATRVYLHELHTNHRRVDMTQLLQENDLMDDSAYLRGHIFSERILDT